MLLSKIISILSKYSRLFAKKGGYLSNLKFEGVLFFASNIEICS